MCLFNCSGLNVEEEMYGGQISYTNFNYKPKLSWFIRIDEYLLQDKLDFPL